jgi:DNA processing protein
MDQAGIRVITWEDATLYPQNLLLCDDAPPVLFTRGNPQPSDSRAVAIIGTRTPRPESAELAQTLAYELASRGWTIVSGLALGIDAAAHHGALAANGRTLAVLGSGLMRVYPPANHDLAHRIAADGVLLSELHPDEKVSPQHLIARNRITSGLSRAVIVVQSGEDSGSMSTARRARQQGRTVFAVLGGDAGCEALLADGAHALEPAALDFDALHVHLTGLSLTAPSNEFS